MIAMNVFYAPKDNEPFDYDRYVKHMRFSLCTNPAVKAIYIQKEIPGKGYTATGDTTWPTMVCIGTLIFDSYEDFETKYKPYVKPLREDIKFVTNLRAQTNFCEVSEVPNDPLTEDEQKMYDEDVANAAKD